MLEGQSFAQLNSIGLGPHDDLDVYDAFKISYVAFVIRDFAVFDTEDKETDLTKLIAPATAVSIGLPNKPTAKLIDHLLGGHHEPALRVASAIANGDEGFTWKLEWNLFPSPGGFSGIPYEYHAVVRANGTSVIPELYLCDDYSPLFVEEEEKLYSVMAIDDLLPVSKAKVQDVVIQHAAEGTFNRAISEFKIEESFRPLAPQRHTFSARLASDAADVDELEVWAVRFVLSTIENPTDVKYDGSIIVWVRSDLKTSELTIGSWNALSVHRHSNAK